MQMSLSIGANGLCNCVLLCKSSSREVEANSYFSRHHQYKYRGEDAYSRYSCIFLDGVERRRQLADSIQNVRLIHETSSEFNRRLNQLQVTQEELCPKMEVYEGSQTAC